MICAVIAMVLNCHVPLPPVVLGIPLSPGTGVASVKQWAGTDDPFALNPEGSAAPPVDSTPDTPDAEDHTDEILEG